MDQTPASLLERLRQPGDAAAWSRLVRLFTPLLYSWARRLEPDPQDAADLVQDIFLVLVQKLPQFKYDENKSFRAWLHTVTLNKCRENRRRRSLPGLPAGLEKAEPAAPDVAQAFEEAEYQQHLLGRAIQVMRAEFEPSTWQACWEFVVSGRSAAEVAAELGISESSVYVTKHRVLKRLRLELDGLLG